MKKGFYSRMALNGLRKNRKLYLPYIMTGILVVVVFYLMTFLSISSAVSEMSGGGSTQMILSLGKFVIAVFSAIFLLYTNSFLIRKRKKEFGLYNVLGMDRKNIGKILVRESLFTFLITVIAGLLIGITLSKLAELCLLNLMHESLDYSFSLSFKSIGWTILLFGGIYFVIYLNSLRQIRFSTAVELVKSENSGENPPKANRIIGILGILLLAGAYYLAVRIQEPMEALLFFFVAVIMVIIATYLIFISGSVLVCRLLQKNKRYYYKANHFVSVSSMAYRMKRNGAGLASICILLTMVLVMISSSSCLYAGKDAALTARYPCDINVSCAKYGYSVQDKEYSKMMNASVESVVKDGEIDKKSVINYYEYCISGYLEDSHLSVCLNSLSNLSFIEYNKVAEVHFIDLKDYNRIHGTDEKLNPGEAMVCAVKTDDVGETFSVEDKSFKVVKRLNQPDVDFVGASASVVSVTASVFAVVNNAAEYAKALSGFKDYDGTPMILMRWYYQFDSPASQERQIEIATEIEDYYHSHNDFDDIDSSANFNAECHNVQKKDFYGTFGGLFFIGILLSIAFLVATALIVYYKQISEGFEDRKRFEIMRNVGMTKEEIKKSINSQMLTVFLLPVGMAVLHLAFAFPVINKLLMLFGVFSSSVLAVTTTVSILICLVFYVIVYKITSNTYYSIVTSGENE